MYKKQAENDRKAEQRKIFKEQQKTKVVFATVSNDNTEKYIIIDLVFGKFTDRGTIYNASDELTRTENQTIGQVSDVDKLREYIKTLVNKRVYKS